MANNTFNATALANGTSTLTQRTSALNLSSDLVQAGVVFNDATRLLVGGAFAQPTDESNQPAYLGMYTTDIHAVQNDIANILATPASATLGGQAFTLNSTDTAVLTEVQSQLGTLLTAAPQTTNVSTSAAAEQTLHSVQSEILQEINTDPHIAAALNNVQYTTGTGANNVGFQLLPAGADDAASLTAAQHGSSLSAVGQVFNAATDLAIGGLNANNLTQFTTDMTAVQQGLTAITNNQTLLAQIESGQTATAAALTTIHLQTALAQVNLQLDKFDGLYASDPNVAMRSTNDNLLDIIDIIQNDANLNKAAGGNGNAGSVGGFAEQPAFLNGADGVNAHGGTVTQFQDNQAQTNFWAAFLAEANTINAHLQKVATGGEQASQALITQIQNYQQFGANFDASQGGTFGARFDNELLSGTLLTDTNNAVAGLTGILNGDTGAKLAADHAQIAAAGTGFAADANDVSGNNLPVGGGQFVGTATTVSTATSVHGVAQGTIPVTGTPNIANGTGGTPASSTTTSSGGSTGTGAGSGAASGSGNSSGGSSQASGSGNDTGNDSGTGNSGNGTGATQHHDHGHSGGGLANDIAALLQALQGGNTNAVNAAVTALGNDVHNDPGATSDASHMHFAHLWH